MTVASDFVAALVGLKSSRRRDKIERPAFTRRESHFKSAGSCSNNRSQLSERKTRSDNQRVPRT